MRRLPRSTRTDTLVPDTTRFRSVHAEGREHDPNAELQGVLRHAGERTVDNGPDQQDQRAGGQRADTGRAEQATAGAAGDDNEDHLEPFKKNRLEGGDAGDPDPGGYRSAERRGGKECGSTCRRRWATED